MTPLSHEDFDRVTVDRFIPSMRSCATGRVAR